MTVRGTRQKIRTSASMRGNDNRVEPHFAEDLLQAYGDVPELADWIRENERNLDAPNADGSIPFGSDQLHEHERRKFLAADTATNHNPNPALGFESLS